MRAANDAPARTAFSSPASGSGRPATESGRLPANPGRDATPDQAAAKGLTPSPSTGPAPSPNQTTSPGRAVAALAVNFAAPIALFCILRSAGVGNLPALIAGAVAPALSEVVRLIGKRQHDGLAIFMMTIIGLGIADSLIAGSPRFLPAKDGWLTGVSGAAFLISLRGRWPLAFHFARPLLEGSKAYTSESWDSLWDREPRFRRVWRVSTVAWGIGMLADAAIRVVMAYTLPIDAVPALGGAYAVFFLATQVITNIHYIRTGLWHILGHKATLRRSPAAARAYPHPAAESARAAGRTLPARGADPPEPPAARRGPRSARHTAAVRG